MVPRTARFRGDLRERASHDNQVGRSGIPLTPAAVVFVASTWCSWISLVSKPIREPAM